MSLISVQFSLFDPVNLFLLYFKCVLVRINLKKAASVCDGPAAPEVNFVARKIIDSFIALK